MFKQDFIGYNYVSKVLQNISIFICLPKIFEHMKDDTMQQPAPVPQISSVSTYITQFKMPNTHRISFPGVSDTHVKFYFTQTFYITRVIISPRETKHS